MVLLIEFAKRQIFLMMGFGDQIAHHSYGHEEPTVMDSGMVPTSSITYEESHFLTWVGRQGLTHTLTLLLGCGAGVSHKDDTMAGLGSFK